MTPDELADKLRRLPPRPICKHGSIKSKCTECELVEAEDEIERLRTALAAAEAKLAIVRNDALEKAAKVSKLHIHEDCECPVCNAAKVTAARILALKDIT